MIYILSKNELLKSLSGAELIIVKSMICEKVYYPLSLTIQYLFRFEYCFLHLIYTN